MQFLCFFGTLGQHKNFGDHFLKYFYERKRKM